MFYCVTCNLSWQSRRGFKRHKRNNVLHLFCEPEPELLNQSIGALPDKLRNNGEKIVRSRLGPRVAREYIFSPFLTLDCPDTSFIHRRTGSWLFVGNDQKYPQISKPPQPTVLCTDDLPSKGTLVSRMGFSAAVAESLHRLAPGDSPET